MKAVRYTVGRRGLWGCEHAVVTSAKAAAERCAAVAAEHGPDQVFLELRYAGMWCRVELGSRAFKVPSTTNYTAAETTVDVPVLELRRPGVHFELDPRKLGLDLIAARLDLDQGASWLFVLDVARSFFRRAVEGGLWA